MPRTNPLGLQQFVQTRLKLCGFVAALFLAVAPVAAAPFGAEDVSATAAQLRRALAYRASGDLVRARIAFETVFRLDNLPPDLQAINTVYAQAAEAYLAQRRLLPSAYAVASLGNYRERDTNAGAGSVNDGFGGLRVGGRIAYVASDRLTLNTSLDYRFRAYDNPDRRNDSDLRWSLSGGRALGSNNLALGVRGWASHRGGGITRNDYGVFTNLRIPGGSNDQFAIGGELRRRSYPEGRLRDRSRDIAEATASWTRAFAGGNASVTLAAHGGREFNASGRPDGDSRFFGLSPSLNVTISDTVGAFAHIWWQNERYNVERYGADSGDKSFAIGTRNDDLFEIGGGFAWNFAPGWEVSPTALFIRDWSNVIAVNYSSFEVVLGIRKDF